MRPVRRRRCGGRGDVALTVELPAEGFVYAYFVAAIATLSSAAGENYDEVLNLSQDTTAVSSYSQEE